MQNKSIQRGEELRRGRQRPIRETEFAGSVRRDSHCSIANRHVAVDALADQIMEVFQVGYRPRLC